MTEVPQVIAVEILQIFTSQQAVFYRTVPVRKEGNTVVALTDENANIRQLIKELELVTSATVQLKQVDKVIINELLVKYYRATSNGESLSSKNTADLRNADGFLDDLVLEAKNSNCSDIHIEAFENKCRVRFRIDGKLIEKYSIEREEYQGLINKLKIKSNLDIAEKRLPQDGRITFKSTSAQFDMRVSIIPSIYGEKVVLRILSQDSNRLDLNKIGMNPDQLTMYKNAIRNPDGIILISGPTGSGKTTTLYATLKELNSPLINISTVEDPIEYTLDGINQVLVKDNIGLSFATTLRAFLRQDPDIIMLGEIRDSETAEMAIRASLTGHLVLSTIHTNSAIDTIDRLIDMGIPSFLISSTLTISLAQRLIRKLCNHCKSEIAATQEEKQFMPATFHGTVFKPIGCDQCYYTGYSGRIALYEILPISTNIRDSIRSGESLHKSIPKNYQSLSDHAISALIKGETSLEEVYPLISNR